MNLGDTEQVPIVKKNQFGMGDWSGDQGESVLDMLPENYNSIT